MLRNKLRKGCGRFFSGLAALKIHYELPMPQVVVDVIIPPLTPPKTKAVKTVKFLEIQTRDDGAKSLRNPANTSDFVQGHKNRALQQSRKSRLSENVPTAKCTANTSTLGCFDHKNAKKDEDWQPEEEKKHITDYVQRKCCK